MKNKKLEVGKFLGGFLAMCAAATHAETQTWAADPASAEWSTTAANWDAGVPWMDNNAAAFGASTKKAIDVPGQVFLTENSPSAKTATVSRAQAVCIRKATSNSTSLRERRR